MKPESFDPDQIKAYLDEYILLTKPLCPELESYTQKLASIWSNQWFTNSGPFVGKLEDNLIRYLGVEDYTVFSSGTVSLQIALKTLEIEGEVILPPVSFPATLNPLIWQNLTPRFCDVDDRLLIDPQKIEELITPNTRAILGVHLWGNLCDRRAIQDIADRNQLMVIYDAAHAFTARINGDCEGKTKWGDATFHSFHATKLFHCAEGGGVVFSNPHLHQIAKKLRNFGINGEHHVELPGINGKMSELHAAMGLEVLKLIHAEIEKRRSLHSYYCGCLADTDFVEILSPETDVLQYFTIKLKTSGMAEKLYKKLREHKIVSRRYSLPLLSNLSFCKHLPSASPTLLPHANQLAPRILCLPFYGNLDRSSVSRICDIILSTIE